MEVGRITLVLYGVLLIIGGILGYTEKRSLISLVSGVASGLIALAAYALARTQPRAGLGLGLVVSLILIGAMWMRFQKTGKVMPAGMLLAVSVIVFVVLGAALLRKGS
ncbi:MAG TPA: TMEM14 family protein [Chthonomonadaceae bacterium]|nr:TMEM14 family protein [Chthonomonadaceae bacterium]